MPRSAATVDEQMLIGENTQNILTSIKGGSVAHRLQSKSTGIVELMQLKFFVNNFSSVSGWYSSNQSNIVGYPRCDH